MRKLTPGHPDDAWLEKFMSGTSVDTKTPAFRPALSPSEQKAEQTTRALREMNESARDQRVAATAKLKAARLGKEVDARTRAAQKPPKTKKGG